MSPANKEAIDTLVIAMALAFVLLVFTVAGWWLLLKVEGSC